MALTSEARALPLGALYAGGLALLFVGERLLVGLEVPRYLCSGLGVLLMAVSTNRRPVLTAISKTPRPGQVPRHSEPDRQPLAHEEELPAYSAPSGSARSFVGERLLVGLEVPRYLCSGLGVLLMAVSTGLRFVLANGRRPRLPSARCRAQGRGHLDEAARPRRWSALPLGALYAGAGSRSFFVGERLLVGLEVPRYLCSGLGVLLMAVSIGLRFVLASTADRPGDLERTPRRAAPRVPVDRGLGRFRRAVFHDDRRGAARARHRRDVARQAREGRGGADHRVDGRARALRAAAAVR